MFLLLLAVTGAESQLQTVNCNAFISPHRGSRHAPARPATPHRTFGPKGPACRRRCHAVALGRLVQHQPPQRNISHSQLLWQASSSSPAPQPPRRSVAAQHAASAAPGQVTLPPGSEPSRVSRRYAQLNAQHARTRLSSVSPALSAGRRQRDEIVETLLPSPTPPSPGCPSHPLVGGDSVTRGEGPPSTSPPSLHPRALLELPLN